MKVYTLYEIIPYKNSLGEIEHDLIYIYEFYNLDDLANTSRLQTTRKSIEASIYRAKKHNKKIIIKKRYADNRYNTYYQLIIDNILDDEDIENIIAIKL